MFRIILRGQYEGQKILSLLSLFSIVLSLFSTFVHHSFGICSLPEDEVFTPKHVVWDVFLHQHLELYDEVFAILSKKVSSTFIDVLKIGTILEYISISAL